MKKPVSYSGIPYKRLKKLIGEDPLIKAIVNARVHDILVCAPCLRLKTPRGFDVKPKKPRGKK